MVTLTDIIDTGGCPRGQRIARDEVRLLWHADFWDGPQSGMLIYRDEQCWYEVVAENVNDAENWYRRFAILRLSPEQYAEELRWHKLFQECVGGHTDYDEYGKRPVGSLRPQEQWAGFYEAYRSRTPPDFSGCEVLGWFEW